MPEQRQQQLFVEAPGYPIIDVTEYQVGEAVFPLLQQPNASTSTNLPQVSLQPMHPRSSLVVPAPTVRPTHYVEPLPQRRILDSTTDLVASFNTLAGTVIAIFGHYFWKFNEMGNDQVLNLLDRFPGLYDFTDFLYSRPDLKLIPSWEGKIAFYTGLGLISLSLLVLAGSITKTLLSPPGQRRRYDHQRGIMGLRR